MRFIAQLRLAAIAAAAFTGLVGLNAAQAQTSGTAPSQSTPQSPLQTPGTTTRPGTGTTPGTTIQPGTMTQPGQGTQPGTVNPGTTSPSTGTAPTTRPAPTNPVNTGNQGLAELLGQAASAGTFSTLARAVQAAGVANAIPAAGNQQFTIFAPTDQAFAALPAGTLEKLLQPENQALLRQVLAYHVVPGEVTSGQLRTGVVNTLGGGVAVRVAEGQIIVNDASVIQPDIQASNGVIHVVNRVLLPEELRQRLISLQ